MELVSHLLVSFKNICSLKFFPCVYFLVKTYTKILDVSAVSQLKTVYNTNPKVPAKF